MFKKIFLALLIVVVSVTACKKKKEPMPVQTTPVCLIVSSKDSVQSIGISYSYYSYYYYDSNNRLDSLVRDGSPNSVHKFKYDSAGNKIKDKTYSGSICNSYVSISYDANGRIDKDTLSNNSSGTFIPVFVSSYTYNTSGQTAREDWLDPPSNISGYNLYNYDANGNIIQEQIFIGTNLNQTIIKTYDTKNSVLTQVVSNGSGTIDTGSSFTATYTYNSDNSINTMTETLQMGTSIIKTYTYNCK